MNFKRKQLEEIKKLYNALVWVIVKNCPEKKLNPMAKERANEYNIILDLIEDIEELTPKYPKRKVK